MHLMYSVHPLAKYPKLFHIFSVEEVIVILTIKMPQIGTKLKIWATFSFTLIFLLCFQILYVMCPQASSPSLYPREPMSSRTMKKDAGHFIYQISFT